MFSIPVMRALSAYNIAYAALPATNAYMSFTPTADAAKQKQFTLHIPLGLIKPGAQTVFAAGDGLSTNFVAVQLSPTGQLDFVLMSGGVYVGRRTTTRTLQDYSGFYFVTLVMDTPNATALDRMRVYFNLTRETDFATTTNPAQNLATSVFAANVHNFLKLDYAAYYGDVYLGGNTCLIGQVLEPSNFLDLDLGTGNVKAKDLTPLSPEYLFMFENAVAMGTNSGSAGDATLVGTLNQVGRTPTNTFPTIDPNILIGTGTVSNGNRSYTRGATTTHDSVGCSMRIPSTGKYGWRVNPAASTNAEDIGIAEISTLTPQLPGTGGEIGHRVGDFDCAYRSDANKWTGNTGTAYGATWNNTNYMHVGCDADAGTVEFFKDGVSQGVAFTGVDFTKVFVPALSQAETSVSTFDFTDAPAGYSTFCTNNLPAQTGNIDDHFRVHTWAGDNTTPRTLDVGLAAIGFGWIKDRTNINLHNVSDTCRGLGQTKTLCTNNTSAEGDSTHGHISAITATGVTLTAGSLTSDQVNGTGNNYVGWFASLPNTVTSGWAGTYDITPTKEIYNADLGMSIITFNGNGTAGATLPCEMTRLLGKAAGVIIIKNLDDAIAPWAVYHVSNGATKIMYFNEISAAALGTQWNNTEPTSTLITLGNNDTVNKNTSNMVAYIFAETEFCKIGSYVGNGSADGPMVNTGISPVWMLHKNATTGGGLSWMLFDNKRKPYNHQSETELSPNLSAAEPSHGGGGEYDFASSGIKQRTIRATYNSASNTYIYLMIGQPNGPVENTAR